MPKIDVTIISALTGLVGTISGALISFLTLKHSWDKDNHRVSVELGRNLMINTPGIDNKDEQLTITVANLGALPFKVANVSIKVGRRTGGLYLPKPFGTHELPVTLQRDETCTFWTSYRKSEKNIKELTPRNSIKIRASVSSYTGRSFQSNWLKIRIKETGISKFSNTVSNIKHRLMKLVLP